MTHLQLPNALYNYFTLYKQCKIRCKIIKTTARRSLGVGTALKQIHSNDCESMTSS